MDPSKDAERILQYLGGRGRWQLAIYLLHAITFGSLAFSSSSFIFLVDTPPYHCKVPSNSSFNDTIPAKWKDGKVTWFDSCQEYINISQSNLTQPCSNGYWFDPDYGYESTITMDFELVCEKAILVEHSMMLDTIIFATTSLGTSYLTDRIGRKTMLLIATFVRPFFGIADSFMLNPYVMWGVRIIGGILKMGLMNGSFLLALEMFPSDKRTLPGTGMEVAWAIGMLVCTPVLYHLRNWRHLTRALSIPSFIFYITIFAPESITWLVRKGKYDKVKKIVLQAAKCNKQEPCPELLDLLDSRIAQSKEMQSKETSKKGTSEDGTIPDSNAASREKQADFTYRDLFRYPKIRLYTLIQIFIWFVNIFVYIALSLTVTYLPGNRYTNFLLFAAAELVAAFMHVILLSRYGRRIPLCIFHLLSGVGLMLTIVEVFKDQMGFNWVPMIIVFNVIGRLGISASFMTIYMYTPEIYPTNIRGLAIGVCQTFSSVAGLIGPYTRVLERHQPGLLRGICGLLAILAGVLGLLLPETHNRPLPETIEDVETRPRTVKEPRENQQQIVDVNAGTESATSTV